MKHNRLHASARLSQVLSMVSFLFAALIVAPLVPAQPALGSAKSSVQNCNDTNLKGALAYSNVYAGGALITIAVVNVGVSACRLSGYPRLLGIRDGREYPLANVRHGTQDVNLRPAILAARMSGAFIIDTPLGCNASVGPAVASDQYSGVIIILPPSNGHVRVDGVPLYVPCGLGESSLGWAKGFVFN